jgi:glucan phosphoethanolaminetransferase (alkaline phosphatase superfamily)
MTGRMKPNMTRNHVAMGLYTLFFFALGGLQAGYIQIYLRPESSPIVSHFSIVASAFVLLYYVSHAVVGSGLPWRWRFLLIWLSTFFLISALSLFYVVLTFFLKYIGRFPSKSFVSGYLHEVPTLLAALPLERATLAAILIVVIGGPLLICAVLAQRLVANFVRVEHQYLAKSARHVWLARLAGISCLVYLLLAFSTPLDWHLKSLEPLTASWHDVSLTLNSQYEHRNLIEAARDRQTARDYKSGDAVEPRPNVILIYVDALRADVTQPYGYYRDNMPFVSGLVQRGDLQQVEYGLANCPATICGLAALLQSRSTRRQNEDNFSLPRVLAQVGYRNAYILSSNHQDYFNLKKYYQPIHFYLDGKDLDPARSTDDYLTLEGLRRLGRWSGEPTFLMIGLVSPHPFAIKRDEHRRYLPDRLDFSEGFTKKYELAYRNNYDNGLLQADDVLKLLWSKLKDQGYLRDDSIVVITSDHGESLGERGIFGHVKTLYNTELRIPVWVKAPGRIQNLTLARQTDIAPTVLEIIGLPIPQTWEGRSLMSKEMQPWSEHYLPDQPDQIALVYSNGSEALKYLFDNRSKREQVYAIRNDPHETNDVIGSVAPELLEEMRQRAQAAFR